jgi:hypothetical protein
MSSGTTGSNFTFTPNFSQPSLSTPTTYLFHGNNHVNNKQSISMSQMYIEDLQNRLSNAENRLMNLEMRFSSIENKTTTADRVIDDQSKIKDEAAIKNIIKIQMTADIIAEVIRDPLLKVVHDACFQESTNFSKDVLISLKLFESSWNEKGKKFEKHEQSDTIYKEKNLIKRKFYDIIRMSWMKYNIFNNSNPLNDLVSTGIQTSGRLKELLEMISIQFVAIVFNNKLILNQILLPPFTRKLE